MTSDPVAPNAVVMLQRMHARAVDRENHGDVQRIGSDELLAVLRATQAERDRHAEEVAMLEAELANRRAHDEDVRTCLEYCDEDDPTPGGVGGLARELLEWFSGRTA